MKIPPGYTFTCHQTVTAGSMLLYFCLLLSGSICVSPPEASGEKHYEQGTYPNETHTTTKKHHKAMVSSAAQDGVGPVSLEVAITALSSTKMVMLLSLLSHVGTEPPTTSPTDSHQTHQTTTICKGNSLKKAVTWNICRGTIRMD